MEYYYCPGLLKFLRYLWVSVASQTGVFFFFPAQLMPSLLFGSAWLAASLISLRNGGCFKEEGMLGKGMGTSRGARSPDSSGDRQFRTSHKWPQKYRKTRAVSVSCAESDISLT